MTMKIAKITLRTILLTSLMSKGTLNKFSSLHQKSRRVKKALFLNHCLMNSKILNR